MGLCGGSNDTTVTNETQLPDWLEGFAEENVNIARAISERPYENYPGQRLAGFTPDQQQAFQGVRDNQGAWQPYMDTAGQTATEVAGYQPGQWTDADVDAYMNPYQQQVIDRTLAEMNRQQNIDRNRIGGNMASAGAFGGSRHGVVESEYDRNAQRTEADTIANLLASGYTDAANRWLQDQGLTMQGNQQRLAAANQLGQVAGAGSRLGYADAAALLDSGERQRQLEQSGMDLGYEDFLRQQNYPIEMLNLRLGAAGSNPYPTTSTQTQPGGNQTASALGSLGLLASGIGSLF